MIGLGLSNDVSMHFYFFNTDSTEDLILISPFIFCLLLGWWFWCNASYTIIMKAGYIKFEYIK